MVYLGSLIPNKHNLRACLVNPLLKWIGVDLGGFMEEDLWQRAIGTFKRQGP
jgi:hypothetical protein